MFWTKEQFLVQIVLLSKIIFSLKFPENFQMARQPADINGFHRHWFAAGRLSRADGRENFSQKKSPKKISWGEFCTKEPLPEQLKNCQDLNFHSRWPYKLHMFYKKAQPASNSREITAIRRFRIKLRVWTYFEGQKWTQKRPKIIFIFRVDLILPQKYDFRPPWNEGAFY